MFLLVIFQLFLELFTEIIAGYMPLLLIIESSSILKMIKIF